MKNEKVWKIAMTGVFAALSYVVFTFLQFKIWLPGGDATSIHFGNAVCVLGALILGGVYGGIGGAIGMTIGDLLDPVYVVYAPKTFILKFCIGLIAGLIAHKIGKINEQTDQKQIFKWALLAAIGGLLFNVIFDPLLLQTGSSWKTGSRGYLKLERSGNFHQRRTFHHRFRCHLHGTASGSSEIRTV